jgi:hypothetical protein
MSNSQLYNDFFEGNLDTNQENEFMELLITDETFRLGLKGYVGVSNTINSNIKLFGPSTKETSELYSKLGFAIPAVLEPSQVAKINNTSFLQKPFLKYFLTGLTSSIFTLLTVYFIWSSFEKSNPNFSTRPKLTESKPLIVGKRPEEELIIDKSNSKTSKRYQKINQIKIEESNLSDQINPQTIVKQSSQILSLSNVNSISFKNYTNQSNPINELKSLQINDFSESSMQKYGISFEIRNSLNWNLPKETIYPSVISKFNNVNLAVVYDISDNFKVSADLKQETFYTEYSGVEADNQNYNYKEQANFTTLSFGGRCYPFSNGNLKPYTEIDVGFNKAGYVVKPALGIEYSAYSNLSFLLVLEYDKFWFSHQNNWFTTSKLNLNYGLAFHI